MWTAKEQTNKDETQVSVAVKDELGIVNSKVFLFH
jgi:hypothetical protein